MRGIQEVVVDQPVIVFMTALFFLFRGVTAVEPFAAIGSMGFFASVLFFAWIAMPVLRKV